MSEDNKLIEKFLYQVAIKNVTETRSSDFRDVFGSENVGALLNDLHQEKEQARKDIFDEPKAGTPVTREAIAADQAKAVAKEGIKVGKVTIPPEQLASLVTRPEFANILSQIKKSNPPRRVGEPPPPTAWKPQVIHRPKV